MFFNSRRSTVLARNGMVATSQPLAAMAGLRTLMQGGNAGRQVGFGGEAFLDPTWRPALSYHS